MKKISPHSCISCLLVISCCLFQSSCTSVGVFEKNVTIPGHTWPASFKPDISFEIQDTTAFYTIYIVVRHTDAYHFNNLWLNVTTIQPDGKTTNQPLDLTLATDSKGWLGSGMDDIFEHRIPITPPNDPRPLAAGTYHFIIEHIMREEPLENIMNIGVRLEKAR